MVCALVAVRANVACLSVDADELVGCLPAKIMEKAVKILYNVRADDLKLYLAKDGDDWISSTCSGQYQMSVGM